MEGKKEKETDWRLFVAAGFAAGVLAGSYISKLLNVSGEKRSKVSPSTRFAGIEGE